MSQLNQHVRVNKREFQRLVDRWRGSEFKIPGDKSSRFHFLWNAVSGYYAVTISTVPPHSSVLPGIWVSFARSLHPTSARDEKAGHVIVEDVEDVELALGMIFLSDFIDTKRKWKVKVALGEAVFLSSSSR